VINVPAVTKVNIVVFVGILCPEPKAARPNKMSATSINENITVNVRLAKFIYYLSVVYFFVVQIVTRPEFLSDDC
jgi:hypothetical protein